MEVDLPPFRAIFAWHFTIVVLNELCFHDGTDILFLDIGLCLCLIMGGPGRITQDSDGGIAYLGV